ncbi:MAG: chloride channel protein [Acidobacteriota bacterium]
MAAAESWASSRRLVSGVTEWLGSLRRREDQIFLVLTLVVGALVGLVTVSFIVLTENLGARMYPPGCPAWRRVVVPLFGSLLAGILLYLFFPEARGSGVPQTKAALYVHGGVISLRTVLGKFFCTSVTLASGIPLGREGPSVQVGAGIASLLGRRVGLSKEHLKQLFPAGVSAAIAAAFNTPLAAVLFSLEEIMGNLHAPVLGSVVLSATTSWLVLRLLLGNEPLFHVPEYTLVHPVEFALYGLLGLIGGLVSAAFVRLLLWIRARFLRFPVRTRAFQPGIGGLAVGLVAWFVPEVLGVGYTYVGGALNNQMSPWVMGSLVVLKLLLVCIAYGTGNAGGIFGPSLFLGAMLGGTLGSVAHLLFPGYTATPGAYALVGMGAVFAGIVRAPMTSVLMIFEVTRDYAIIVPLMISNLVAYIVSMRLQRVPIYEALAKQDGIHLPTPETRADQEGMLARDVMGAPGDAIPADITVPEAAARCREASRENWPVARGNELVGMVSLSQLTRWVSEGRQAAALSDLLEPCPDLHVHPDHDLVVALKKLGQSGLDTLPVVSRGNPRQLEGIITLEAVLRAYGIDRTGPRTTSG